jgi:hypothetical protein
LLLCDSEHTSRDEAPRIAANIAKLPLYLSTIDLEVSELFDTDLTKRPAQSTLA